MLGKTTLQASKYCMTYVYLLCNILHTFVITLLLLLFYKFTSVA